MVFCIKTPENEHTYHVAGSEKLTEAISDATRYHLKPGDTVLRLDPIPDDKSLPFCLALVEILEVNESYTKARWGVEEAIIPTEKYHSACYVAIRDRLAPFVRIGGGPFGSNVRYGSIHSANESAALFDIAFRLPHTTKGLVNVSNPRVSKPLPPLPVTAEDRLGLRTISFKCNDTSTEWFRIFNDGFSLLLTSGFGADQKLIQLTSADATPVTFGLPETGFAEVYPRLLEFIPKALGSDRGTARKLFITLFSDL